ncbi:hypothetical protein CJF31_00000727 [Rutstroemia sp. NJR-2017a BVV2]|nr:hypothetical protein CJF31_00000727 [Rutstroemia sp. NJR-2017a BVV2]
MHHVLIVWQKEEITRSQFLLAQRPWQGKFWHLASRMAISFTF